MKQKKEYVFTEQKLKKLLDIKGDIIAISQQLGKTKEWKILAVEK